MIRDDSGGLTKPERAEIREHYAFVGNGRRQDRVKGRDPIGRNQEKAVSQVINISNFPAE